MSRFTGLTRSRPGFPLTCTPFPLFLEVTTQRPVTGPAYEVKKTSRGGRPFLNFPSPYHSPPPPNPNTPPLPLTPTFTRMIGNLFGTSLDQFFDCPGIPLLYFLQSHKKHVHPPFLFSGRFPKPPFLSTARPTATSHPLRDHTFPQRIPARFQFLLRPSPFLF